METRVTRFGEIPWHTPVPRREDIDHDHEPADDEAGRKFLVDGEEGFYVQTVRVPAGFEAPLHRHSHAEVFMVVAGSCVFNGEDMGPLDSVVVRRDEDYGFRAGPQGVTFVVTRGGLADYREATE